MIRWHPIIALLALPVGSPPAFALPQPTFYCTFDRSAKADFSRGEGTPTAAAPDAILYEANVRFLLGPDSRLVEGQVGRALMFQSLLQYPVAGNFNPLRGTIMMWVQPTWEGSRTDLYTVFFSCQDWGLVYKYTTQDYITFGWIKEDARFIYGSTGRIKDWKPGEWHHLAVTFDALHTKQRATYLDGQRVGSQEIPSYRPCAPVFGLGAGVGGVNPARAAIDEFAIFDRPLSAEEIAEAYEKGRRGRPLFPNLVGREGQPTAPQPPPPEPRPPRPAFVNWELPPGPPLREWRRANQRGGRIGSRTRERVALNGLWRFRPVGARTWHYLRVPGSWFPSGAFQVRNAEGQAVREIDNVPLREVMAAWYEREFVLPSDWHGQRIMLGLDSVRAIGEVFLNGRYLGRALEFQRCRFEVSPLVRPGRNLLQVRVQALSFGSVIRGLDEDVWLERRPAGANVQWVDLHPLVTQRKMEVVAELTETPPDAELVVSLFDLEGRPIGQGRGQAQEGMTRLVFDTSFLQPWHPDVPRLYLAQVALERHGECLDELYPIRFGYRQLEIRGGDFYLNGQKFHLRGQAAPPFGRFHFNVVEEAIREWIGQMKAVHVNAVREYSRGWSSGRGSQWRELYYDLADEMGFLILTHLPSNRALVYDFRRPVVAELYRQRVADFVHRYGNHACVAMWFLNFNHGAHVGDIRPDLLDGSFDPRTLPEKRDVHAWMDFSERVLTALDSSRPVFHHAAGNYGQVLTVMAYLGFGIPLQEREEWPSAWARTRFKPLMPVETGFPCLLSNYRERVGSLAQVYASEQLTPEYFAAYVGDRVYANLTEEEVRLMNPGPGDRMGAMKRSLNYDEQKALFARWTLRSWRTYDLSGYCQHVEWRDCFRYEPTTVHLPPTDPRNFGLHLEQETVTYQRRVGFTRLGRVARVDNAPLLAYIAGPQADFVGKEHAFFVGETVEKSVVLINDTPKPVEFSGGVEVTLGPRRVHVQPFRVRVEVGEVKFVPVRFTTPTVTERTEGTLTLSVQASGRQLPTDTFAWECWPRLQPPKITGKIALLDSVGRTEAVLRKAGLAATAQLESDTRLLVIGRESLTEAARQQLRAWNLRERVRAGLNVLVFEQTGTQLADLPLDDPNARAAFIRAPMHPVLRGLTNADLRHWRGQSDLTEPYPRYSREDLSWGEEFVRWGNRGVVCSFAPEKPQRGNFTVLVDADFDLYLAPLLEWRIGRGRIVFCQLDVTGRYGRDPVPTLLIHRLLTYLTTVPPASTTEGVILRGGRATVALAQMLAVPEEPESRVLLLGPDGVGEPEELQRFAQRGGRVLIAGHWRGELISALFGGSIAEEEVFKVQVPPELAHLGVAPGDFFWRQVRPVPVLQNPAADVVHTVPAVVAWRRLGQGEVIWCSLTPADFTDSRPVAKTLRLLSVLLRAGTAHPDLLASAPTVGQPTSPYARRSLDFNPYKYRRW